MIDMISKDIFQFMNNREGIGRKILEIALREMHGALAFSQPDCMLALMVMVLVAIWLIARLIYPGVDKEVTICAVDIMMKKAGECIKLLARVQQGNLAVFFFCQATSFAGGRDLEHKCGEQPQVCP